MRQDLPRVREGLPRVRQGHALTSGCRVGMIGLQQTIALILAKRDLVVFRNANLIHI